MASEHTIKRFDQELERLNATINEMGGLTESQLSRSLEAVRERDTSLAEQVISEDARVDALDDQVQQQTVQLLALRQPMAVDLRVVLSSIKIAAALERIADYAKNTAKRTHAMSDQLPRRLMAGVTRMGRLAQVELPRPSGAPDVAPPADFLGLAVNGRRVQFTENVFYEFDDSRIRQVWSVIDKVAIEAQL